MTLGQPGTRSPATSEGAAAQATAVTVRYQVADVDRSVAFYADDLARVIEQLRERGVRFLNDVEAGPGGKQILIADPDGKPIELHEAEAAK